MAEDHPDRYLINMAKKQRTGRIFLDSWEDYCEAVRPLEPAIRKLVGSQPKRSRSSADSHARA